MSKVELPCLQQFVTELRFGIAKTFQKAVKDHSPDFVYGFCIYTDDDAQSLCCIVSTLESVEYVGNYYYTNSWKFDHAGNENLRKPQRTLSRAWDQYMKGPAKIYDRGDDRYWKLATRFKESVFAAMLNGMIAAKKDGVFGGIKERRHRFITFDITDSQRAEDRRSLWVRRLNVPTVAYNYESGAVPDLELDE